MDNPVVLFDGECNLCTWSVQFIMRRDPGARFRFASLQSPAGQRLLAARGLPARSFDSFVLVEGSQCFTGSEAALRVVHRLAGWWPLLGVLSIIPRPLRDRGYALIARNRFRWFGRRATCLVPTRELLDRFLDSHDGAAVPA